MSFDDDERSIEASTPRDLFEFILPAVTHRVTSAVRDITHNGQTYRAIVVNRESVVVPSFTEDGALQIPIVVSHALPQRYLRGGIPPRRIDVNVYRLQLGANEAQLIWSGTVTSMSIDRHIAKFLVPARTSEMLHRRLPTLSAGRTCPHVLYDAQCRIDRSTFKVVTTATIANGRDVTVASMGGHPDQWAQFGELLHVASGERMTIQDQTGTAITMQLPIADMVSGAAVEIYAGCAHDIFTCRDKFANQVNFGGMPHMPTKNPFLPNGLGIYTSE